MVHQLIGVKNISRHFTLFILLAAFLVPTITVLAQSSTSSPPDRYWIETDRQYWQSHRVLISPDDDSPRAKRLRREEQTVYSYSLKPEYQSFLLACGIDSIECMHSLPIAFIASTKQALQRASQRDSLFKSHPLHRYQAISAKSISGGGSDYGSSYEQLAPLGIPEAQEWDGLSGNGVLIGVLDDGFILEHRSLKSVKIAGSRNFVAPLPPSAKWFKNEHPGAHGTAVLSLMAGFDPGVYHGGAPQASYLLARVFDARNQRNDDERSWVRAVEWCEENGAEIITSSLTFDEPKPLTDSQELYARVAREIRRRGVILICSAGNEGPKPGSINAPSTAASIWSIAALDAGNTVAKFSSRGPTADHACKPEFAAQGDNVVIASLDSASGYTTGDGTSYATPLVAATFALLREAHPDWTADKIEDAMISSCEQAASPDNDRGYGTPWLPEALLYPIVSGQVLVTALQPIRNASVLLLPVQSNDSISAAMVQTDSTGRFEFTNVADGTYRVWVPPLQNVFPIRELIIPGSHYLDLRMQLDSRK